MAGRGASERTSSVAGEESTFVVTGTGDYWPEAPIEAKPCVMLEYKLTTAVVN